ncbi:hypothetical protein GDO81_019765 [Engystomops pustulosus]|uniref:Uncharacterized protein n=1 Tax=Engystomops pustulosus TaxID=76066 RepID=A0AAV6YVN3_ENGPU|nr:hypothetical protein GDO81_019765 [Engystomops pustulosus]
MHKLPTLFLQHTYPFPTDNSQDFPPPLKTHKPFPTDNTQTPPSFTTHTSLTANTHTTLPPLPTSKRTLTEIHTPPQLTLSSSPTINKQDPPH